MKILVPVGCRSDERLSAPIIKRMQEHFICNNHPTPPPILWIKVHRMKNIVGSFKPDLVFISGEWVEMCVAAAATITVIPYGRPVESPPQHHRRNRQGCCFGWSDPLNWCLCRSQQVCFSLCFSIPGEITRVRKSLCDTESDGQGTLPGRAHPSEFEFLGIPARISSHWLTQ